ncbi:MAG TPA: ATP-dependent DNA ligase [Rhizomicrobium sp.]|jgi:ATP-dependent DNA ligase|nr:ATP-dependent DNA ligase [Rhizomicrobium sp.]
MTPRNLSAKTLRPMEARLVSELPRQVGWQFEPKWYGFRCLAFKRSGKTDLRAKSGKALTRFFPEIAQALEAIPAKRFVLDGELLIPRANLLSFDALQMRLHPAQSRIEKISRETPALLMCFDMLENTAGENLLPQPLTQRRKELEALFGAFHKQTRLRLSPYSCSYSQALAWLRKTGQRALDGVIAKPLDEPYQPGKRAMMKVKCLRTADCVVGGFRYATGSNLVGSLLLGLYNDKGKLDHVGFTSGIADADRKALTKKLEALRGGEGFTGDAPGGPSRWSTERSAEWVALKPKFVAEVQYDHVTGERFRHGTRFLRCRPDKAPKQCDFDQLAPAPRPPSVIQRALRPV